MTEENKQNKNLKELLEEKERLVAEGKYLEADEIKEKIEEMKKNSSYQKNDALYENQEKERQDLENDYESERRELEDKWDKKIQEFVESGKKMEEELVELHNQKMEEYVTTLTKNYPRIKYSPEYLNGRVQENKLAKQERFIEAEEMKPVEQEEEQEPEQKSFKEDDAFDPSLRQKKYDVKNVFEPTASPEVNGHANTVNAALESITTKSVCLTSTGLLSAVRNHTADRYNIDYNHVQTKF